MSERRIDPEPITIFLAVLSTVSATVASANYVRTHLKPEPSRVRGEIAELISRLEDEIRYLKIDVQILRNIFDQAEFPDGARMRFRNGAWLSLADFKRYEGVSENIYRRMKLVGNLGGKLEKQTSRYAGLETRVSTNYLGEAYSELDRLLDSRDLYVSEAWERVERLAALTERALSEVRRQIAAPSDA